MLRCGYDAQYPLIKPPYCEPQRCKPPYSLHIIAHVINAQLKLVWFCIVIATASRPGLSIIRKPIDRPVPRQMLIPANVTNTCIFSFILFSALTVVVMKIICPVLGVKKDLHIGG